MSISNVNPAQFEASTITHEVILPSRRKVTIRERNGEDEESLSNVGDFTNGTAVPKFLARLTGLSYEEIQKWPIRDKYYLLLKERILSIGSILTFVHRFSDGSEQAFDEDLSGYDWDYSKPFPKEGEINYKPGRALPYPEYSKPDSFKFEGRTASGKNYRMLYLTGEKEISTLGIDQSTLNSNKQFTLREFEVQLDNGLWVRMERFSSFTARDMAEFRNSVQANDQDFNLSVIVKHPKSGLVEETSLMTETDFFLPRVKA